MRFMWNAPAQIRQTTPKSVKIVRKMKPKYMQIITRTRLYPSVKSLSHSESCKIHIAPSKIQRNIKLRTTVFTAVIVPPIFSLKKPEKNKKIQWKPSTPIVTFSHKRIGFSQSAVVTPKITAVAINYIYNTMHSSNTARKLLILFPDLATSSFFISSSSSIIIKLQRKIGIVK